MKKITVEEQFSMEGLLNSPSAAGGRPQDNLEERLKDMDESGIDMQVISCVFPHGSFDNASDATAMVKRINDQLSRVVKKYPKRFASFASLAPQDPNATANELERAVKDLGFKGAMVESNVKGEYFDDQKYWIIFERAEKLGVPIYLHPSIPSPDMIKPFLTYPVLTRAMWGFAAEAGLSAMRLICSGVFDKYPGLKIILGHMGEGIPYWLWRIDNRWERGKALHPDWYVGNLQKTPSQYFRENFYVTTSGMFWPPALQFICSVLEDDKILFAVDYPQESNKVAVEFIESTPISDSTKEKICHLNTEKLLRL